MSKKFSVSITECIICGIAKRGWRAGLPRVAIRTGQQNRHDNCEVFGNRK